jgi:hypothetical protein
MVLKPTVKPTHTLGVKLKPNHIPDVILLAHIYQQHDI